MSVFDGSIYKVGNTINAETLTAVINSLCTERGTDEDTSSRTTTSGSNADLHSTNITLEADEVLSVTFAAKLSATASNVGKVELLINGALSGPAAYFEAVTTRTDSAGGFVFLKGQAIDLTGSIVVKTRWLRNAGAGTIYCSQSNFFWEITKRRT